MQIDYIFTISKVKFVFQGQLVKVKVTETKNIFVCLVWAFTFVCLDVQKFIFGTQVHLRNI